MNIKYECIIVVTFTYLYVNVCMCYLQSLYDGKERSIAVATNSENRLKNRFANICPCKTLCTLGVALLIHFDNVVKVCLHKQNCFSESIENTLYELHCGTMHVYITTPFAPSLFVPEPSAY